MPLVAAVLALSLFFAVLRAVLAAGLPLVEDEAYYALWAAHPAWGYYDHPPLVAWMIAAGTALGGDNELAVRAPFILSTLLAGLLAARIGWRLGGRAAAIWASLFVNVMPASFALGLVATPDAPSMLFWTAAVAAVLEARAGPDRRWWLAAGLAAGLGVLAKFTTLFLGLAMALWLLGTKSGRMDLRTPWPWLAGVLALLVMVPLGLWNIRHDWIGLERQFGRLGEAAGLDPAGPLVHLGITLLLVTPGVALLALRGRRAEGAGLVLWLCAPLFVYLLWHAAGTEVAGNWLLPLYPSVAALAGAGVAGLGRQWPGLAAGLAAAITALALGLAFAPAAPPVPGHNPASQTRGWPAALAELRAVAATQDLRWIATTDYGLSGHLWWYLREEFPVRPLNEPWRYLFLPAPEGAPCEGPGLLVHRAERPLPEGLADTPLGTVARMGGGAEMARYALYAVPEHPACRAP